VAATKAEPPPKPAMMASADAPIHLRAEELEIEGILFSFNELSRWAGDMKGSAFVSMAPALNIGNVAQYC